MPEQKPLSGAQTLWTAAIMIAVIGFFGYVIWPEPSRYTPEERRARAAEFVAKQEADEAIRRALGIAADERIREAVRAGN